MKRKKGSAMTTEGKKKQLAIKTPQETAAIHAVHEDGAHHAVAILNLHVLIVRDGNYWFAQGLEIDYAVQGESVEDAKKQFQTGFRATIYQHLKIFGHIDNLLRVAPNEIWQEYLKTPKAQKLYTHASMHEVVPELTAQHPNMLQFEQIEYVQTATAYAA